MEASLHRARSARAHDWPDEWTPGKPFANCYWLRNPNYPAETIIVYEDDPLDPKRQREVKLRDDRIGYLKDLRASCLGVGAVQTHFLDPGRAWDEALKLNDGGVGYLAEALAPVCNPALKQGQVLSRLSDLRAQMAERLERFYVSDDLEERLKQRLEVAGKIVDQLYAMADLGRFGHLIRALQVPADELADVLYRIEAQPPEDTVIVSRPSTAAARRPRPLPTGLARAAMSEPAGDGTSSGTMIARTREELLAEAALKHWIERLHPGAPERQALPQPPARDREPGRARERADRGREAARAGRRGERCGAPLHLHRAQQSGQARAAGCNLDQPLRRQARIRPGPARAAPAGRGRPVPAGVRAAARLATTRERSARSRCPIPTASSPTGCSPSSSSCATTRPRARARRSTSSRTCGSAG